MSEPAPFCTATVRGPKRGRIYVYDAHRCNRRTRHESGRCPSHRRA